MIDPCRCGLTPEIMEIKSVTYVAVCRCGNHGPAMSMKQWAESEWNEQAASPAVEPASAQA